MRIKYSTCAGKIVGYLNVEHYTNSLIHNSGFPFLAYLNMCNDLSYGIDYERILIVNAFSVYRS